MIWLHPLRRRNCQDWSAMNHQLPLHVGTGSETCNSMDRVWYVLCIYNLAFSPNFDRSNSVVHNRMVSSSAYEWSISLCTNTNETHTVLTGNLYF